MALSPIDRKNILESVFPNDCEIVGVKNLKKICQENKPELTQTQYGSNMMFVELITMFFQALGYMEIALSVVLQIKELNKEEPTAKKVVNITINNFNLDTSKLSEEKQLELAELALQYSEKNV